MNAHQLRNLIFPVLFLLSGVKDLAAWPKVLVLPAESETDMDMKVKEDFQWDLVFHLKECRYYEAVDQKEYESFMKANNLSGAGAIPDSVLPRMMAVLQADLSARPRLRQPGGAGTEFSAQVTYVVPKYLDEDDDYRIESEWYSAGSERESWRLAAEFMDIAEAYRGLIAEILRAHPYYDKAINDKSLGKIDVSWLMGQALEHYRKLVDMEPGNRSFNYMAAMCLMGMRRYDKAVAQFDKILTRIDPDHAPTHEALANYYYFTCNDFENALRHFGRLAEIEPENYTYSYYQALALDRLGRKDEAAEVYRKLIRIEDGDADVRHHLADYYYNKAEGPDAAGNPTKKELLIRTASDHMARACAISRRKSEPADSAWIESHCSKLNFLAILQHELGDRENETATLREIADLDPAFPGVCYNLGVYAHKARNFSEALDYYEKALNCEDEARKAEISFQIGVICLQNVRDYRKAIDAFTAALGTYDTYMIDRAHYFRASAFFEYARELGRSSGVSSGSDALIDSCKVRALADLREISANDPQMVISVQQQMKKIAAIQERPAPKKK